MTSCSNELAYRKHVALNLTYQDVPVWLEKNNIEIPSSIQQYKDVFEYVLEIIENASIGKDNSIVILKPEQEFVKKIQHAAGYTFDIE